MWSKFLFIWLPVLNCVNQFAVIVFCEDEPETTFREAFGTSDTLFVAVFLVAVFAMCAAYTHCLNKDNPGLALWFRLNISALFLGMGLGGSVDAIIHREGLPAFLLAVATAAFAAWCLRWSWQNYRKAVKPNGSSAPSE